MRDRAWQACGTPAAVIVRRNGLIGSSLAQGADTIESLVTHAIAAASAQPAPTNGKNGSVHASESSSGPKIGDAAPQLNLQDLNGNAVSLADFRGRSTMLLFWNPDCGFCQRMLNDLKAWDAAPPAGAHTLVLISSGTVEANRSMQLRSKVLLDGSFQAGTAFGANGTPMAVLLDSCGRVASTVAAGADAVFALASSQPAAPADATRDRAKGRNSPKPN